MARRTISQHELDNFKIDENDNSLYWNDKRVKLERRLTLSGFQKLAALAIATATLSMGATDLWRFACDAGWWSLSCPIQP